MLVNTSLDNQGSTVCRILLLKSVNCVMCFIVIAETCLHKQVCPGQYNRNQRSRQKQNAGQYLHKNSS